MLPIAAARGEILAVDDSQPIQRVQVQLLAGEVLDLPRLQKAGDTNVPLPGTECLVLFINGRSHGYVITDDNPTNRPTNRNPDDRIFYAHGHRVELTATGIHLYPDAGQPVKIHGDLTATGQISDALGTMQEMRDTYNIHGHPANNAPPNQTMT